MLMMDKNNAQIADLIQNWLAGKGLVEQAGYLRRPSFGQRQY